MTTEHNAESASPRRAVLSNEDPAAFDRLVDDLHAVYLPLNTVAVSVVDDIAIARWQIIRPIAPARAPISSAATSCARAWAAASPQRCCR